MLSRIYTRTGDDGTTALGDGSRAAKTDPRLAAYADVDEANCAIGMAITMGGLPGALVTLLSRIQNELFDVGADLCNPVSENPPYPPLRITEAYVAALEEDCDTHNAGLPVLRSFILPGRLARRRPAAYGQDDRAPGGTEHLGGAGDLRRLDEPADRPVPEPPVGPAVHPRAGSQRAGR